MIMEKMPYIVAYVMLMDGQLSIAVQGIYPDYKSAQAWVANKKGYQIIELPDKSGAMINTITWTMKPSQT